MSMSSKDMKALQKMYDQAGKLNKQQIKQQMQIAQMESSDRRAAVEAQRDATRMQVEQQAREMEQIGIPRVQIERFVAEKNYEIAQAEIELKKEMFLAENGLARDQLALDREQMERVGIPQVEINRYVAERQAEMAQQEYLLSRDQFAEGQRQFGLTFEEGQRQFDQTHAEERRQFNVSATGYIDTPGTLDAQQQVRMQQLQSAAASGTPLAAPEAAELQQYQDILSGAAGGLSGAGRQATLEREQFQQTQLEQARRYGLDVAQFGAQLASTPDTYFQARRFQGVDVPRLLGGAGAGANVMPEDRGASFGAPTPGVATMGAYLAGQDPYGGGAAGAPTFQALGAGTAAGGGEPMLGIEPWQQPSGDPYAARMAAAGAPAALYGGPTPQVGAAPAAGVARGEMTAVDTGAQFTQQGWPVAGPESWVPGGGPGSAADDRQKQLAAIARASPPSPYAGLNEQDASTLRLMESIYKKGGQGVAGGELERLKASGRYGFLQSAGRVLGYDPAELESQYKAYRPSQGSSAMAG